VFQPPPSCYILFPFSQLSLISLVWAVYLYLFLIISIFLYNLSNGRSLFLIIVSLKKKQNVWKALKKASAVNRILETNNCWRKIEHWKCLDFFVTSSKPPKCLDFSINKVADEKCGLDAPLLSYFFIFSLSLQNQV
jgi:hypothetical protein